MADLPALDEDVIRVLPDLVRSIQDLRLAVIMALDKPSHARAVAALERVVEELYRLRAGSWIDEVAQEIASDSRCSDPRVVAAIIRRFAARTTGDNHR